MAAQRGVLLLLTGLCVLAVPTRAKGPCAQHTLDFILLEGEALSTVVNDDIKRDLAKIGITVNVRLLDKPDFNKAMQDGDFHMCLTESWGPPYDPHAFATGWFRPENEAHYPALDGLEAPMTKATLEQMVTDVLKVENVATRQTKWTEILQEMHSQAISNPMWSRRMPAVINRRLQGYVAGPQQFDYPMHPIEAASGSTSVTVAPGAQTGLFKTTGPMDPHSYRPNEFFISNWIYEGLVYYGQGGVIEPMLATAWIVTDTSDGGQEYKFTLRQNVKFHDGTAFNCAAVKMNFDHVLQPPLNTLNYHGWYHLPKYATSWRCDAEVFVVKLSEAYYPFLQELSLIRPLRMLAPESFQAGASSSPVTHNSCPTKWSPPQNMDGTDSNVQCVGVRDFNGTGPWKVGGITTRSDGSISEMKFLKNDDWWGPRGNIDELIVKNYNTSAEVEQALLARTLDMVVGGSVLTPAKVKEFNDQRFTDFQVVTGPPLMNKIIVMNAARTPTDDLELRKTVMHAVDKAAIVANELAGSARVADSLFPKDAPYCDVDLTPRYDYDLQKAKFMNCPVPTEVTESGLSTGWVVVIVLCIVALLVLVAAAFFFVGKKKGEQLLQKSGAPTNDSTPPYALGNSTQAV
jgi:ABC-type transport system substrate-binding protein